MCIAKTSQNDKVSGSTMHCPVKYEDFNRYQAGVRINYFSTIKQNPFDKTNFQNPLATFVTLNAKNTPI